MPTEFIIKVETTGSNETFTLPCGDEGVYNAQFDWGDGVQNTITSYNDPLLVHTYATAGIHTITVTGTLPWVYFNNTGDRLKVVELVSWGDVGRTNANRMFYGCSNIECTATGDAYMSGVTDMQLMMHSWSSTTSPPDLTGFDTSNVTNMQAMMRNWPSMTSPPDLSSFNTSKVTNMSYMMANWASMTSTPDLSSFNTSNVTTMQGMMYGWSSMTSPPDLTGFDTSNVTDMQAMMMDWASMTSTPDLSSFDTSKVTNIVYMMYDWPSMTSPPDLTGFDTSNVTNMYGMMHGWSSMTSPPDLSSFNTSNVTDMSNMMSNWWSMTSPPDLSSFDTSNVTSMGYMMSNWASMTSPPDLTGFNTSNVTNMQAMMYAWSSMTSPPDLSSFNTSKVTDMSYMMTNWSQNIDVSHFNVTALTTAADMFVDSAFSDKNFNKLLVSWSAQAVLSDVPFHAGTAKYSKQAEYDILTGEPNRWIISSGGYREPTQFKVFGSEDSRGAPYEVITSGASDVTEWDIHKQPGGVVFNIDDDAIIKDTRMKVACSSEIVGSNVKSKIHSNGNLRVEEEVGSTLDHSNNSIYNVGHYNSDSGVGLYHSFQLFDKPLTDEQLKYISQPGNNPKGCS